MILTRRAIVFDLDGTLIDTAPDLCGALNWVLAREGRPLVPVEDVRHMVGEGARKLIERGLAASGPPPSADDVEGHVVHFLDHYRRNLSAHSVPFPGVEETLDALADLGAQVAICTNKPQGLAVQLLDELGLGHRFPVILGGDSLPVKKPNPGHVIGTVERMGAALGDVVFVGDSHVDVAAARGAGVPVVAVSFGYSLVDATELGADVVIDTFPELLDALDRLS
ncbi:MAG: phosphoglycolate phosphatase [Rhodospirillales bacterium]|nr:phosphoglycolate phosphatase [Rhodospirillales bacterium]